MDVIFALQIVFMKVRYAAMAMICLALTAQSATAQDVVKDEKMEDKKTAVVKNSRDFLMLQIMYNGWLNAPDSIKTKGINRGFNAYVCL